MRIRRRRLRGRLISRSLVLCGMVALCIMLASGIVLASLGKKDEPFLDFGAQFHGFWNYENDQSAERTLQSLRSAGVRSVRIDMGWKTVEPERGEYADWALEKYDGSINLAHSAGMRVLLTIQDSPRWANGDRSKQRPPTDPADFADFARMIAERYAGKVDAIEVWNEPNNPAFFRPQQEGQETREYAALLRATHEAIQNSPAGKKVSVVAGGTQYVDDKWWDAILSEGACEHTAAITVNPYQLPADAPPGRPDDGIGSMRHLDALSDVLDSHDCAGKPIWFTEFGWSTHDQAPESQPWAWGVSERVQGERAIETLQLLKDEYPQVTRVFWYNARDRGEDASAQNGNFGMLRRDLSEKPILRDLREFFNP